MNRAGIRRSHGPKAGGGRLFIRIADITIALDEDEPVLTLAVQGTMQKFVVDDRPSDVTVHAGLADLSEESGGKKVFDSGSLWQLYIENGFYRFRFSSPLFGPLPYKLACFDRNFTTGTVCLHRSFFPPHQPVYPLEYPLDELLLMHLLARGRGAEVHACGVVDGSGNGHLFVGQSGAGKTTLARLWQAEEGVKILSDDRIVLRNLENRLWMYGTPWHGEARLAHPSRAPLTKIYFLCHGERNGLVPQTPTAAAGRLLACSFPPFYSPEALEFTLAFFEQIVKAVPCAELRFIPDESVVPFIRQQAAG